MGKGDYQSMDKNKWKRTRISRSMAVLIASSTVRRSMTNDNAASTLHQIKRNRCGVKNVVTSEGRRGIPTSTRPWVSFLTTYNCGNHPVVILNFHGAKKISMRLQSFSCFSDRPRWWLGGYVSRFSWAWHTTSCGLLLRQRSLPKCSGIIVAAIFSLGVSKLHVNNGRKIALKSVSQ